MDEAPYPVIADVEAFPEQDRAELGHDVPDVREVCPGPDQAPHGAEGAPTSQQWQA